MSKFLSSLRSQRLQPSQPKLLRRSRLCVPKNLTVRRWAWLLVLAVVPLSGCAPGLAGWTLSYDEAQKAAQARQSGIVVLYKDHLDPQSGRMEDVLRDSRVTPLLSGKVKCLLLTDFEPNRRFVAQYGVEEPPALIVIHPDQTSHARSGLMSVEQVVAFLKSATPPGTRPQINPQVPRTYGYNWLGIYEEALGQARRQNRPLLIVYKWWLSSESTELLRRLSRPEVARHFGDMVHCLLDWDYIPNRKIMADLGVNKVPAMVIITQSGTRYRSVGLVEIKDIIKFAVSARPPE